MSTVVSKNVQIGADGTASNNFTIYQPASPDGTLRIGNGNTGTTSAQVVLTSAGNVGIGTSSPGNKLTVDGTVRSTMLSVANSVSSVNQFANFTVDSVGLNIVSSYASSGSANILFSPLGTERMRIDSAGNVGIGTSSPTARVQATISTDGGDAIRADANSSNGIMVLRPDGTNGNALRWGGNGANGNIMRFVSGGDVERMRIDSSGNLLVGTTVPNSSSSDSFTFQPANKYAVFNHTNGTAGGTGYMFFSYNVGSIGSITQNGTTAVAYNTASDYRLKENVQPLTGALSRIAALKPCTYTWKSAPDEIGEGFIAHELQEVCPQAVTGTKDAVNEDGSIKPQSVDTSFLVATLTAAIQEQQAIITALTARVEALEGAQA